MKQRQWKTTRQLVERPDAQRRFDQAYQCLLSWIPAPTSPTVIQVAHAKQEEPDENSRICPCLHPAPDTTANH